MILDYVFKLSRVSELNKQPSRFIGCLNILMSVSDVMQKLPPVLHFKKKTFNQLNICY